MEICSNICSLRDTPLSRPFSVSEGAYRFLKISKDRISRCFNRSYESHSNKLSGRKISEFWWKWTQMMRMGPKPLDSKGKPNRPILTKAVAIILLEEINFFLNPISNFKFYVNKAIIERTFCKTNNAKKAKKSIEGNIPTPSTKNHAHTNVLSTLAFQKNIAPSIQQILNLNKNKNKNGVSRVQKSCLQSIFQIFYRLPYQLYPLCSALWSSLHTHRLCIYCIKQ